MMRRRESRAAIREGKITRGWKEQAIRFHPASTQFLTRSCARCAGLLVKEWYDGSAHTSAHNDEVLRCVQCGHRVDSVIVLHQSRLQVANVHMRGSALRDSGPGASE